MINIFPSVVMTPIMFDVLHCEVGRKLLPNTVEKRRRKKLATRLQH